jgi:hypothetical protein
MHIACASAEIGFRGFIPNSKVFWISRCLTAVKPRLTISGKPISSGRPEVSVSSVERNVVVGKPRKDP